MRIFYEVYDLHVDMMQRLEKIRSVANECKRGNWIWMDKQYPNVSEAKGKELWLYYIGYISKDKDTAANKKLLFETTAAKLIGELDKINQEQKYKKLAKSRFWQEFAVNHPSISVKDAIDMWDDALDRIYIKPEFKNASDDALIDAATNLFFQKVKEIETQQSLKK